MKSRGAGVDPRIPCVLILCAVLCACTPRDPVQSIRELQEKGQFAESLEPLRELIETRPDDPELHFLYGVALRNTGQPGLALWSLRKASGTPGWEVAAGLELGGSAFESRNFPVAIEAATHVLESEPENLKALNLRAEARLEDRSHVDAALADFDRVLELDPDFLTARISRATALLQLERKDEAEAALEELNRQAEDSDLSEEDRARFCVARATFAKEKRDLGVAEQRFTECLDAFPRQSVVLDQAMQFFEERRQPERAIELLRAAIERTPEAVVYREALAARLRGAGQTAEAEALLRAGTEVKSPYAAAYAWRSLADHYVALGENTQAVSALERALELDPNPSQQLLLGYADLLVAAGQNDRALAVAAKFEHPFFGDLIQARIRLNERRPKEALGRFESALRFWPDNAAARYYSARAAEGMGDFDRAIEEYRQSIRSGAKFTDAGMRLARLYEAEGSYRLAAGALVHHVKEHGEDAESLLLELQLRSRLGETARVRAILALLQHPPTWARAVSFLAERTGEHKGAKAGAELLRKDARLDLTNPRDAIALRTLVTLLLASGAQKEALARTDAAVAKNPEAAIFHEIRGSVLERLGSSSEAARAEYQRAAELDAKSAEALAGLARLAARDGDTESALASFDRAVSLEPNSSTVSIESATLLARLGRTAEAEKRLEDLLWEQPYDAAAAMQLAELRLGRGLAGEETLALVRRALRFGGGRDAQELLERVSKQATANG